MLFRTGSHLPRRFRGIQHIDFWKPGISGECSGWFGFARVDYRDGSNLQGLKIGGIRYRHAWCRCCSAMPPGVLRACSDSSRES